MRNQKMLLCQLFFLLAYVSVACATNPLEVKRFKQWGYKYLTVTNNWNGMFANVVSGDLPPTMALITAVNGESTEEMTPETFDKKLSQGGDFTIDYIEKDNGVKPCETSGLQSQHLLFIGIEKASS